MREIDVLFAAASCQRPIAAISPISGVPLADIENNRSHLYHIGREEDRSVDLFGRSSELTESMTRERERVRERGRESMLQGFTREPCGLW